MFIFFGPQKRRWSSHGWQKPQSNCFKMKVATQRGWLNLDSAQNFSSGQRMHIESAAAFWRWSLLLTAGEVPWARQKHEPGCSESGCNSGCWKTETDVYCYFHQCPLTHFSIYQSGYILKDFIKLWTTRKTRLWDDQWRPLDYWKCRPMKRKSHNLPEAVVSFQIKTLHTILQDITLKIE